VSLELATVPVALRSVRAAFEDLLPVPVDGILGTGVLARFLATLDYRQRVLTLNPRGQLTRGVPLYLGGALSPLVQARLNDRLECLLLLDTGMTGTALALPPATARLMDLDLNQSPVGRRYGVGASRHARPITLGELTALGVTRGDMPAVLTDALDLEHRLGFRVGGLLGQGFLEGGVLELDLRAGRARLTGV
jgi:hypothetical protein